MESVTTLVIIIPFIYAKEKVMSKIVSNFYLIRLDGEPVYVGYTNRPIKTRFREHLRDKDFGDIEPTMDRLGKLEYDFTWNEELINQCAKEVSDRETELILEYGTQDSVWQKGLGSNVGGQTWANVKYFVKTNRDNPKFRGLPEEAILAYLETSDKVYRYINHFVNHMDDSVFIYMGNFVKNMDDLIAIYLKNFVSHMDDPISIYMGSFVNTMNDPVNIYMKHFVDSMNDAVRVYMMHFVSAMNDPASIYMKGFVSTMNDTVTIYVSHFVSHMSDLVSQYIMGFVRHIDDPVAVYMGSFVGTMSEPVANYMKNFIGCMKKPIDNQHKLY